MSSLAKTILKSHGKDLEIFDMEQESLVALVKRNNESKYLVKAFGLDTNYMEENIADIIMKIEEEEEKITECGRRCYESWKTVVDLIDSLDKDDTGIEEKFILTALYLNGRKLGWIAKDMGISERSVKRKHDSAIKKLDKELDYMLTHGDMP